MHFRYAYQKDDISMHENHCVFINICLAREQPINLEPIAMTPSAWIGPLKQLSKYIS